MKNRSEKSGFQNVLTGLLLAGLCLLGGCFDATVELELDEQGEGSLDVRLELPANLATNLTAGALDNLIQPFPAYRRTALPGRVTLSEKCNFPRLEDLVVRRMAFKIETIGTGVLGVSDYTFRLWAWLHAPEGDLPDRSTRPGAELETQPTRPPKPGEAAERARRLLSRTWGDRAVSLVLRVPGRITRAQAVVIGAYSIQPRINSGKNQVVWRAPVSELINNQVRATQVFRADFRGSFAFRVPAQSESKSRAPKPLELEAWAKQRKKNGI